MSSRAHPAAVEQTGAPAPQIEGLAFNTAGHAMHVSVHFDRQVAKVYEPKFTPYTKAVDKARSEGAESYRASLEPTEIERGGQELGMDRFLVGKRGPLFGTQPPVNIMRADLSLLAVVKIVEEETKSLKYWVLLKPKTSLCTSHTVSQIEVFFVKDFRENLGRFKLRGPAWSKTISYVALGFAQKADNPFAKQQRYRRAKDTTRLVLEPNMCLVNELTAFTHSYKGYMQLWHVVKY